MLDLKFIRQNSEIVRKNCYNRNVTVDIDLLLNLDLKKREIETKVQSLRAEANKLSSSKPQNIEEGRSLRSQITALVEELKDVSNKFEISYTAVPNLTHPSTPVGIDETFSKEIGFGKAKIKDYDFKPKDHLEIGASLNIIDMEAGTKVAGPGFYFLKNEGAFLELALQNFVVNKLVEKGFSIQITPDIAKNEILSGTGYVPRGNETNTYTLEDTNLSLIATAEIPLCGQYASSIVDVSKPKKICGISHCFRTERAAGKATKGLYRVHQFTKVEMVVLCAPQHSEAMHDHLLSIEREIFDDLEIPYRVLDIASGDLGASAYRKYDIEAWMPGRGINGEYGEVTSASNCTDYQSRRLNIKYVNPITKQREFVHTLNGTGIAISRALVAILENHQTKDGIVILPKVLAGILNKNKLIPQEK